MTENQVEFVPFHTINEFMRSDFRLSVVKSALSASPNLPETHSNSITQLTKKLVKIPGFRHPEKAPAFVRTIPTAKAFEKNADLVAAILAAWAEAHDSLRTQVFEVLVSRNWKTFPSEMHTLADVPTFKTEQDWGILPLSADRTKIPGFLVYWPKGETFEALYKSFTEKYPDSQASLDEVSLMAVWLTMRLPVNIVDTDGNLIPDEEPAAVKDEPEPEQ